MNKSKTKVISIHRIKFKKRLALKVVYCLKLITSESRGEMRTTTEKKLEATFSAAKD